MMVPRLALRLSLPASPAPRPRRRRVFRGSFLVAVALVMGTLVAPPALAATTWTFDVSPAEVPELTAATYTVTITNTGDPADKLGCVKVTIPSTYTDIGTPSNLDAGPNKQWVYVSTTGTTLMLRADENGDRLGNSNEAFTFDVAATTPSAGSTSWQSTAYRETDCTIEFGGSTENPKTKIVTVAPGAPLAPTIDTKPTDPSNDPNPVFAFSSAESGVTFECKIDSGAYAPCDSGDPFPVTDGSRTFTVRALDAALNASTETSYTWIVDTSIPAGVTCSMVGTEASETITGTAGNDVICGLGGIDTIDGVGGHDLIIGGGGADSLTGGAGNDFLIGGPGADTADGGEGRDFVSYQTSPSGVQVTLNAVVGNTGGHAEGDVLMNFENLTGSPFGDTLTGDGGSNGLYGMNGDDTLNGLGGSDTLVGRDGADTLIGGDGIDVADYYHSPAAVQVTLGTASGNTGGDALGDSLSTIERLQGSNGFGDTLTGDDGPNTIWGLGGNDTLYGMGGNDILEGGAGTGDTCNGGAGSNTIRGCP